MEANDLMMRASARLREDNDNLRALGKLCLANGALDRPPAAPAGGGRGGGRRGGGAAGEDQGAMLQRMALDRRLEAEQEFARKRLAAAQRTVRPPACAGGTGAGRAGAHAAGGGVRTAGGARAARAWARRA